MFDRPAHPRLEAVSALLQLNNACSMRRETWWRSRRPGPGEALGGALDADAQRWCQHRASCMPLPCCMPWHNSSSCNPGCRLPHNSRERGSGAAGSSGSGGRGPPNGDAKRASCRSSGSGSGSAGDGAGGGETVVGDFNVRTWSNQAAGMLAGLADASRYKSLALHAGEELVSGGSLTCMRNTSIACGALRSEHAHR